MTCARHREQGTYAGSRLTRRFTTIFQVLLCIYYTARKLFRGLVTQLPCEGRFLKALVPTTLTFYSAQLLFEGTIMLCCDDIKFALNTMLAFT